MIRVGIVGCGNIAKTHAWALTRLEGIEIVAFCDVIIERAETFSKEYTDGRARSFASLDKMLEEVTLDVLHICTPHYLHVPMAIASLQNGVSVFCEKPPAISMEQFEKLSKAQERYGAKVGFCFQNRYNKTTIEAKKLILDGVLGKVTGARAFVTWRRDEDYYKTDWKGRLETEGGGALINQSIHSLDLIIQFLGKPTLVKGSIANHHLENAIEVEDTVEAWMSFEGGKRACFYASTGYAADAPVIIEIQCENGRIHIYEQTVTVYENGKEPRIIGTMEATAPGKSYWGNGHLSCIKDYYGCLGSGTPYMNDLSSVRDTMETMMMIYENREV